MKAIICRKNWAILLAVAGLGICTTARADEVVLGSDFFQTVPGTTATIYGMTFDLVGVPFGPGLTDTIVERTQNITINGTPTGPNIQITGLSMVTTNLTTPLYVSLDPANLANDTGVLTIDGSTAGGTFATSFFDVYFEICTAPGVMGVGCGSGTVVGSPLEFVMNSSGIWNPTPPPGAVIVSGPVGDIAANLHTGLTDDEVDFFPEGWTAGAPIIENGLYDNTGWTEQHLITVAPTPEPGTLLLFATQLAVLGLGVRKILFRKT